ncbi:hypothetical protein HOLleu_32471 [Holothuria leucospilota]|uniref:Uncharacterized protein n=1 Tax=Holothuria leucospilota TaxID=206669 RepID=A0A9Q1BIR5_HOLLE|nr:hypothetical protein HOLleu_32471 [Holothuria leucospilota]
MGAALGATVKKVFEDNKIDDRGKQKEVEERIGQLQQLVEMKLQGFYNEMILHATGKDPSIQVPISTVVDKVQSIYATDMSDIHNTLTTTIEKAVGDLLGSNWKNAISDLIKGGLESFFGPTQISISGMISEKRAYHVVWSNNAMIRLDTFVTKTSLKDMAGLDKSTQTFGGYILVVSVVDVLTINKQVFMYEFSKFQEQISRNDPGATKKLEDDIARTDQILAFILSMYEKGSCSKSVGKSSHDHIDGQATGGIRPLVHLPLQKAVEAQGQISAFQDRY